MGIAPPPPHERAPSPQGTADPTRRRTFNRIIKRIDAHGKVLVREDCDWAVAQMKAQPVTISRSVLCRRRWRQLSFSVNGSYTHGDYMYMNKGALVQCSNSCMHGVDPTGDLLRATHWHGRLGGEGGGVVRGAATIPPAPQNAKEKADKAA